MGHTAKVSHTTDCDRQDGETDTDCDCEQRACNHRVIGIRQVWSTSGLDQLPTFLTKASTDQRLPCCQFVAFTSSTNGLPPVPDFKGLSPIGTKCWLFWETSIDEKLVYIHDTDSYCFWKCCHLNNNMTWLLAPFLLMVIPPTSPPQFLQICRCLHFSLPTCCAESKYFARDDKMIIKILTLLTPHLVCYRRNNKFCLFSDKLRKNIFFPLNGSQSIYYHHFNYIWWQLLGVYFFL